MARFVDDDAVELGRGASFRSGQVWSALTSRLGQFGCNRVRGASSGTPVGSIRILPGRAAIVYRPSASVVASADDPGSCPLRAAKTKADSRDALAGPGVDDPAGNRRQPLERDLELRDGAGADLDLVCRLGGEIPSWSK